LFESSIPLPHRKRKKNLLILTLGKGKKGGNQGFVAQQEFGSKVRTLTLAVRNSSRRPASKLSRQTLANKNKATRTNPYPTSPLAKWKIEYR
jgi:hypothetical protein